MNCLQVCLFVFICCCNPLCCFCVRQQALLAAISEKDANIALLELSASNKKKTQEEVLALKRERDKLMHQLKQHVSTAAHFLSALMLVSRLIKMINVAA